MGLRSSATAAVCAGLVVILWLAHGCAHPALKTDESPNVQLVAEVIGIHQVPAQDATVLRRWTVTLRVLRVIQGAPRVVEGSELRLWVHSVVVSFGDDRQAAIGREYRITYLGPFAKDYEGDVEAEPE